MHVNIKYMVIIICTIEIISVIINLHLIKRDGGTSPVKSHQPIKLGGNARSIR